MGKGRQHIELGAYTDTQREEGALGEREERKRGVKAKGDGKIPRDKERCTWS